MLLLTAGVGSAAASAGSAGASADSYSHFRLPDADMGRSVQDLLTPNEPMYFVVGSDGDTTGRLQLSFKYRLFDPETRLVRRQPWTAGMYFGYTQTSLWNLSEDSKPFEDTSYRPSLFWQNLERRSGWRPDGLRIGYEHESNGEADTRSRSLDTLFFHPGWFFEIGRNELLLAPKFSLYLARSDENRDIEKYRGHVEVLARFGREDSWEVSTTARASERGSLQIDLSYPLRTRVFSRTGGFLYLQLFHGYGQSLMHYDEKEEWQLRIGFAFVR